MDIESSIKIWIESKLSSQVSFLKNLPPCPYAREALVKNKISVHIATSNNYKEMVVEQMQLFNATPSIEVAIVAVKDWTACSADKVSVWVGDLREIYFREDLWLLYDHPAIKETVADFDFNHGDLLLFMIQKLSRLEQASNELLKTGYYSNWSAEYFDEVVARRKIYYEKMKMLNNAELGL